MKWLLQEMPWLEAMMAEVDGDGCGPGVGDGQGDQGDQGDLEG